MRHRSWVIVLFCLFTVTLLLSQLSSASTTLRVNEAGTKVLLEDKQTKVSLAIENPTGQAFPAHVRLEILDPQGKLVAVAERDETIKRGNAALLIPLPLQFTGLNGSERNQMLWYRLRYRITPLSSSETATNNPVEGIVSLSEITPDIFQLSVTSPEKVREGTRYRAQIRTVHPVTSRPVKGVAVEAKIDFDGDKQPDEMKVSGITDANGYAALDFDLPRKLEDEDELDLEVVARRGVVVEEADTDIEIDRGAKILVSTDKPLYQPGQVLHARALMFDSSKHAVSERDATLEIKDPEGQTVFSAELKTSRFGIVSADWTIPDNIRLGDYNLKFELDGDDEAEAYASVKVSRYEIPNFAVVVKPDLPYYLPGQNATIEVRADYLFGKPVKRGHVRVVREKERRWNYREQKWETEETEKYEGETNEQGAYLAHIDFSKEHDQLRGEDYSRFRDLSYAAYFTDPTTNRTEQRRFELRLTKSAIHVYLIEGGSRQTKEFPLEFYLSTYYANGVPAQCEVSINQELTSANLSQASLSHFEQPLRTIKTNRYGVAKVSDLALTKVDEDNQATLTFLAHDGKGASGRQTNNFWYSDHPIIRLATNKTLYRQGEAITTEIVASEPEMKVVVDVWQGPIVIQSQLVQLHEGRASLTVPYNKAFRDTVTITAYSYSSNASESRYNIPSAMRRVIYPRERDLKLDVRLNQSTYKPGEEAHADFTVRDPEGRSVESALGVVVFDKAIEERARTDNEFGSRYGFYNTYLDLNGYEGELSGLTGKDLFKLDLSKPIPEGMELVAEIMMRGDDYYPHIFGGPAYSLNQREIFSKLIARQVKPTEDALALHYANHMEYPNDEASLHRLLGEVKLDFNQQRDPWGTPFRASFNIERELDVMKVASAGADKRFDTDDDFIVTRMYWPYFRPLGETLNQTVEQYHKRTGGYIQDAATIKTELLGSGMDFSAQRDRWGKPYALEFGMSGANFTVMVKSGGPNGKIETGKEASSDDFIVWTSFADYFQEKRAELTTALANHLRLTGLFPQNEQELRSSLDKTQLYPEDQRDPWGQSYYVTFSNDPLSATSFTIQTYSTYNEATRRGREISPLTQANNLMRVRSVGADGKIATADDFDVAALSRKEIESISRGQQSPQVSMTATLTGSSGAIMGVITDPQDAVVPNAQVTATHASSSVVYEATTDEEGRFILRNLPAGFYTVKFVSPGFSDYVIDQVPVRSSNITRVDGMLQVGGAMATVEITGSSVSMLNTVNMTSGIVVNGSRENNYQLDGVSHQREQASTPRLREYFPETLVWQPLLETDAQGRAQLDFKLADNITTWKMAVIGSTVDGEVGVVEKEIRAFQPFFVEHDPPRVLTEGDVIQLPVVLRNYLDKSQAVELEIKPESWFALLSPARKLSQVASGDSSRETFDFRAISSVNDGKQRITAIGVDASDAIEKPISVHPDGEERAVTTSQTLGESTTLQWSIPGELITGSLRGELKIYPNLMAHVTESVEGILVRPYGCGEQTISSTYPNLMILRFNKSASLSSPVIIKARKYLAEGYKRLLNYRVESGGFSYWGGSESANFALTAYALRFLNDAREYIQVDEAMLNGARDFLIQQQLPDGSWTPSSSHDSSNKTTPRENLTLTSYIARVIAGVEAKSGGQGKAQTASGEKPTLAALALKHALDYLTSHLDEADDPYMLASYALAAMDAGETAGVSKAIARLRAAAQDNDDGTISWASESDTPFHGWGTAGRIETTALALQALARYCGMQNADCGFEGSPAVNPQSAFRIPQLIDRALLYLLRQKDRYGVWHSTQATINVLNAMIAVLSKQDTAGGALTTLGTGAGGQAEIIVNGRPATSVTLPPGRLNNPVIVDISQFISPGDNQILIRRGRASQLASAQVVSTYYVPWSVSQAAHSTDTASNTLRLKVSFNKHQASINEEVTCKVEASGRNYGGMLLGEIGLPPGADVDRASLELALKNSGWYLSRYDVLPDRVIVYLWPRYDGTRFEFKFRPRFGLTAQSAPSLLYDYYNPEARTIVAPTKFVVR
jgi:phosphoribosylformylglycinamidine (FGAM) synthase PurS component